MPNPRFDKYYAPLQAVARSTSRFDKYYEAPEEGSMFGGLLKPITTPIGVAFDYLNRPSQALAAAVQAFMRGESVPQAALEGLKDEREVSFEDVLAESGMEPGLKRTISGLGLDIATDPLNVVGGLPFKAASKAAPLVKKAASLAPQGVKNVGEALGRRFIPHFGLPQEYKDARRLLESEVQAGKVQEFSDAYTRYKRTTPQERRDITFALDEPSRVSNLPEGSQRVLADQQEHFRQLKNEEIEAKVLDPDRVIGNYVTYLFAGPAGRTTRSHLARRLSARNPFAERELGSIEQAIAVGHSIGTPVELDIAKIAAVRGAASKRVTAVARFFEKAVNDFSLPIEAAPAGFRAVRPVGEMPIRELFVGRAFEPSVADDLEKLMNVDQARDAIDGAFRVATAWWKGYATAANPGFHIRNLASNIFNSWLGGVNPVTMALPRHIEAFAWMRGARPAAIGNYPADVVQEAMERMGISGAGHGAFGEVAGQLEELVASTKGPVASAVQAVNPFSRFNVMQRGGREVGTFVEDVSRIALFLDRLHKGDTLEGAALHTKKYLFDYGELTDFERNIRDYAVPFYTWLRKNIPLQLEHLAREPEKYAHVGKAVEEIEESAGEADIRVPDAMRPEWLQRQSSIQLPFQTSKDENIFLAPDLAYVDLNTFPLAGGMGDRTAALTRTAISNLNPAWKIPIELGLNKEAYTERNIIDPNIGDAQMVRAPGLIALLASQDPGLAARLGVRQVRNREGQVEWQMPARAAYLANQVPFFSKLGKTFNTAQPVQQGTIPGLPQLKVGSQQFFQPRHLSQLGASMQPISQRDLWSGVASRLRGEQRRKMGQLRQGARTQPAPQSQLEQLLLDLVLRSRVQ